MKESLKIFTNSDFGEVRSLENNGKILFCGSDVARALGYSIPSKAIKTHCKGVSKIEVPTNGGKQEMIFITEGDVYRLIMRSKLESAEKFERWVCDEVIPQIRLTGGYIPVKQQTA
jgi:prophage antirepressor-like protein